MYAGQSSKNRGNAERAKRKRRKQQAAAPGYAVWRPQDGPQEKAYNSEADIIGYGGAAGGGKSHLALGFAATKHRRSVIFRRVFPSLGGIIEDSRAVLIRARDRYNESAHKWRTADGRLIEFSHIQLEKDRKKHMGQPRDLFVFDEATEIPESIVRFLIGWNRTTVPDQKCRVLLTFNPPLDDSGDWVTRFFGPWLDPLHPSPAKDGELRFYAMIDGEEVTTAPEPFERNGELITPKSRTFFHASLRDNPILAQTGYGATIDAMPEPLRSLLRGNFNAARITDPWQAIPGDWVRLAQKRWRERSRPDVICSALGVDVARGGTAKTVLAKRYANWVAPLKKFPGRSTPDGPSVAALVLAELEAGAIVQIDALGVGTSPYDILRDAGVNVTAVIASEKSNQTDRSKKLKFRNLRAEMWWSMREALDPANGDDLALPDDPELLADLCAPKWSLSTAGILIESKEDIFERLGRSTDCGDGVVMACWLDKRGAFEQWDFFR